MNRPLRRHQRPGLAVLAVAGLTALPGCAVGGALDPQPSSAAPGVAHLQLSLPLDLKVGEVAYVISGNDIAPIDGVMVASPANKSLGAVVSLPSGHGYNLRVSTLVGANFALCETSTTFDVDESHINEIQVRLDCDYASTLDGGSGSFAGPHADAAANHPAVDAATHAKDAALSTRDASSDAATSHGDASIVSPGNVPHDAGTPAANSNTTGAGVTAPNTSTGDAGAFNQPSAEACDSCRLFVCSKLGDARRVAACYLAWGAASEALPCQNASECPTDLCNVACAAHP